MTSHDGNRREPARAESGSNADGRSDGRGDADRSSAERVTLAISVVIVLGIFGLTVWLSVRDANAPATIAADPLLGELREADGGFYLPVVIENTGDATVEDVRIEAELVTGDEPPATAEITVTFLSGGESVRGAVVFEQDPTEGELTVRVTSYKEP